MEFYPESVFHVYIVLSTVGFRCGSAVLKDNAHILKRYFCDENLKLGSFPKSNELQEKTGSNRPDRSSALVGFATILADMRSQPLSYLAIFQFIPRGSAALWCGATCEPTVDPLPPL